MQPRDPSEAPLNRVPASPKLQKVLGSIMHKYLIVFLLGDRYDEVVVNHSQFPGAKVVVTVQMWFCEFVGCSTGGCYNAGRSPVFKSDHHQWLRHLPLESEG